ncbi:MAG: sigma-70 family RNA polymerase sigma factor [Planctomycetales bacterium]|nr:sigma-70 family RNA polymerase sigma factor [Planctomycetales bacterium]
MTTTDPSEQTRAIQGWVARLNGGDESARDELLRVCADRMTRLTRKMKRNFQGVVRWEQTEDVFQQAAIRLCRALESVQVRDAQHLLRLMATQIRRELIDMSRHYHGPHGMAAHHMSQAGAVERNTDGHALVFDPAEVTGDPRAIHEWGEFHTLIEQLPDAEREVVDLLWYHEMTQEQAAEVLQVSARKVRRLWRSAKLALHEKLEGRFPGA